MSSRLRRSTEAPAYAAQNRDSPNVNQHEDDDDYLTMAILEPAEPVKETSFQRAQRLKKEAIARGQPKSKAEIAAEEAAAREAALSTSLLDAPNAKKSKGLAMMTRMGFAGGGLGKKTDLGKGTGRAEPIRVEIKNDRGGIGMESERKRKLREEGERLEKECDGVSKKAKVLDPLEYRDRLAKERERERIERQVLAAQRMALRLHEEKTESETDIPTRPGPKGSAGESQADGIKSINVLWRGVAKARREAERQRLLKRRLEESLSAMHDGGETAEDDDGRMALGKDVSSLLPLDQDEADEDEELREFENLEPGRRLNRLLVHLREEHRYCLWCKYTYPDVEMEGCPGIAEEEHD
ncbi:hypothetical protein CFIMG_003973RA [Ceratocystis fimbriata CBS 114723]|uniref:G-patch domain-containing protein n=1 Tax=Ceratocystis fimbriata CBS 114723 TaxID=1035309 RepID=A0A2C5WWF2_9PEZI|nr:hypothetical protein CFIMG_003973RA [Ceratocystis fimbriata CBS 114723]